ncbi:hypothetical protein JCM5353_004926 [Sporobolomyces roseus]
MPVEMNVAGHRDSTPQEYHTVFDLPIPKPRLEHSFRLACDLEPVRSLGEGVGGDGGHWVGFTGGHVSSTLFTARILPGGQDSQHLLPASHPSAPLSCRVDTRYLLETSDGVYIEVRTRGWRTGKKEVLEKLSNAAKEGGGSEVPGPEEYKFRLSIEMETDSRNEKYAWLNQSLWIGSGMRSGRHVVYDAYLVE